MPTRRQVLQYAAYAPFLLHYHSLLAEEKPPKVGSIIGPTLAHDHSLWDDGHQSLHQLMKQDATSHLETWWPTPHDRWLASKQAADPWDEFQIAVSHLDLDIHCLASIEWTIQWQEDGRTCEGHMYIWASLLDYPLLIKELKPLAISHDACWGHGRDWTGQPTEQQLLSRLLTACREDKVVPVFAHPYPIANLPVGGGVWGYTVPPLEMVQNLYTGPAGFEVMNFDQPQFSAFDVIFGYGRKWAEGGNIVCFPAGCDDHQLRIEQTKASPLIGRYPRRRRRLNWTVARKDGFYPQYSLIATYGNIRPTACWPPPNDPQDQPLELDITFDLPALKYNWQLYRDFDQSAPIASGVVTRQGKQGRVSWQEDQNDREPHSYILLLSAPGFEKSPDVITSPFLTAPG